MATDRQLRLELMEARLERYGLALVVLDRLGKIADVVMAMCREEPDAEKKARELCVKGSHNGLVCEIRLQDLIDTSHMVRDVDELVQASKREGVQ